MSRSRPRGKKRSGPKARQRPARRARAGWFVPVLALVVVGLIGSGAWWFVRTTADAVVIPEFSARAKAGARLFAENCAACHGENATGTDTGPPLLHKVYEPGHHPDMLFQRAVTHGVMSHHWQFGNMPPVPGLAQKDVAKIITFVREFQRANGIY